MIVQSRCFGALLCMLASFHAFGEMVKLSLHSDLHQEFVPFDQKELVTVPEADIIILAGDIDSGTDSVDYAESVAIKNDAPVILIAGNHEYYGHDLHTLKGQLQERASQTPNVFFLERNRIDLKGVRFLGCTLWSSFDLFEENTAYAQQIAEKRISDFQSIHVGNRLITAADQMDENKACLQWLEIELASPFSGPTVVITHFAPVPECIEPKWVGSELAPYFINRLNDMIWKWQPDYWFYGHTHSNINQTLGKTRIMANQKGHDYHTPDDYQPELIIPLPVSRTQPSYEG
ncbi:metallophosphoesterase [Endozoicomonas sp.]|uniref:metallophosphoesterase n=1 Tax=Endozoicomonas sp. TaxID=1892382 RepID=UPI003AF73E31